jgi:hypothetical protein
MNSSTSIPSMVGGRLTRFCFPWTKMVINSFRRLFRARRWAAVSFRLGFAMADAVEISLPTTTVSGASQPPMALELCRT